MRQITENAARAFLNRYSFKQSNTQVVATANEVLLYLHDNLIAKGGNGQLSITSAGWETNTTKERLNGLLSMINQPLIYQRDFVWYRDIDGQRTEFNDGWNIIR